MLTRFCLYGFFKNQQYFEPFLILVLLEKGLSFFEIGLLVAFREVVVNLFEVASGAVADVYGRRRSMIVSFASYIVSFAVFGLAGSLPLLFLAMFFFGIGEAFRTGTHKAMIFAWLRSQGREDERTRVYGQTRSWSKIGSALSVVLAAVFVLALDEYTPIFFVAIVPYAAGIVNFLGYPAELDGDGSSKGSVRAVASGLRRAVVQAATLPRLRRLMLESMGFEGMFRASKDYLQPILQAAAIALAARVGLGAGMGEAQQSALLVGPVFFVLYLMSALASRRSHTVVARWGGEDRAATVLWLLYLGAFAVLLPAAWLGSSAIMIAVFVLLYVVQNSWRPILMARIDSHCDERQGATILSIENQAKSLTTMVLAPVLGILVDQVSRHGPGERFWPVAAAGLAIGLVFVLWRGPRRRSEGGEAEALGCVD